LTDWPELRFDGNRSTALFELIPDNDCQNPEDATRLASELHKDPAVLAVIGHSTSNTTGRVAEIYAQAGIPLIMSEATAASAATYFSKQAGAPDAPKDRVPSYIRLQPSDDQAQAPAIAGMILRLRLGQENKNSTVYLLTGLDLGAEDYSKGLVSEVRRLLIGRKVPTQALLVGQDKGQLIGKVPTPVLSVEQAIQKIHGPATSDDIVFFAGYRQQADDILIKLDQSYTGRAARDRPIILLPEACSGLEAQPQLKDFRLCRTGPADTTACIGTLRNDARLAKWRRKEEADLLPISMVYGHDAVQLVSRAIKRCRDGGRSITRSCVLEQLRATVSSGACGGYSFREGENLLSSYYVFRSQEASFWPPVADARSYEIAPVEIIRIQAAEAGR
jgi:hypothetical protein